MVSRGFVLEGVVWVGGKIAGGNVCGVGGEGGGQSVSQSA